MSDKFAKLLSGPELMMYRSSNEKPVTSKSGQKDMYQDGSWLQDKKLKIFYADLSSTLSPERVEKLSTVVVGEWNPDKNHIEFQKELGKFWMHFGFLEAGRKCLYPEEALYLMETKALEVHHKGQPVSIQEAYSIFLGATTSLEEYQTYSYLCKLGYILKRHEPTPDKDSAMTENRDGPADCMNKKDALPKESFYDDKMSKRQRNAIPCSRWDYDTINIPNMSGRDVAHFPTPCSALLPPEIDLHSTHYTVDVCKITSDSQVKRRKRRDDSEPVNLIYSFSDDSSKREASDWSEYKSLLRKSKQSDWRNGPGRRLWRGRVQPLVSPDDAPSAIQEKLNILKGEKHHHDVIRKSRFKISYDTYLPNAKFKKSNPGRPDHRICVALAHEDPPSLRHFISLDLCDGVPLIWAVVGHGDISFLNIQHVDICSIILTL